MLFALVRTNLSSWRKTTRQGSLFGVLAAGGLALCGAHTAGAAAETPELDAPALAFNHPTYSSPIAISNDDRLVWVVNSREDTVSVIRTDNNTVLKKIAV